jgi:NAD(P)-dependent dehydrogenase (short-subunit alcohol dehydrogenase family)
MQRSVLVTGASSGIGLATARMLAAAGYRVFAGVRRPPSGPPIANLQFVTLDVTSPDSIAAAREEITAALGADGLFALVNNAGIADTRPLEFTPLEKFRAVLEVDLFGVVAVTQAFLPLIHKARGRIVNIGSVGGMITIPFGASLCASKHAIEAISDALRLELHPAGIFVTLIQPASINSGSAEKLATAVEPTIAALPPEGQRRYGDLLRRFMRATLAEETAGSPPEVVATAVLTALRAGRPPIRRLAGKRGHLLRFLARRVPDRWRDALLRRLLLGDPAFGSMPARID